MISELASGILDLGFGNLKSRFWFWEFNLGPFGSPRIQYKNTHFLRLVAHLRIGIGISTWTSYFFKDEWNIFLTHHFNVITYYMILKPFNIFIVIKIVENTYQKVLTIHVSKKVVLVIAQQILPGVNNVICVNNI